MFATEHSGWASGSKVFVTSRTLALPVRHPLGNLAAINLFVAVAKRGCLGFPNLAVAGCLSAKRMRDFVENDLLNLVHCSGGNKMLTYRDSLLGVVAKAGPADRPVIAKRVVHEAVGLK